MRQLFNSRQIRALRRVADAGLPDRVTLRNPSAPTRGAGAGVVAGTPVDTTNVPCRRELHGFRTGDVQEVAGRLQLVNPAIFVFKYNQANLNEGTKIIDGSETFNVLAVMTRGEWGMAKRAICDEV